MASILENTEGFQGEIGAPSYEGFSNSNFEITTLSKGQLWGALRKTWRAYKISKAEQNHLAMMKYADRIRNLQSRLGLELSRFAEVGLN